MSRKKLVGYVLGFKVDNRAAELFAKRYRNPSVVDVMRLFERIEQRCERLYDELYGGEMPLIIGREAVKLSIENAASNEEITDEMLYNGMLPDTLDSIVRKEAEQLINEGILTEDERKEALKPFEEVIMCEECEETRAGFLFIYNYFCKNGLKVNKDQLRIYCLKNKKLFPNERAFRDIFKILHMTYDVIEVKEGAVYIAPAYIHLIYSGGHK